VAADAKEPAARTIFRKVQKSGAQDSKKKPEDQSKIQAKRSAKNASKT